jgi:hypothetical protein
MTLKDDRTYQCLTPDGKPEPNVSLGCWRVQDGVLLIDMETNGARRLMRSVVPEIGLRFIPVRGLILTWVNDDELIALPSAHSETVFVRVRGAD